MQNEVEYDKAGRMKYNPEFHENNGKGWTTEELIYLVKMKDSMTWADLSLALGRTHSATAQAYYKLKKEGLLECYKDLRG